MKNKLFLLLLSAAVVSVSACSKYPSDSEIKKAAIGEYEGACKLLTIEDYQKVNGVAGNNDNSYQEIVKFTVKVAPIPGAQGVLDNFKIKNEKDHEVLSAVLEKIKSLHASGSEGTAAERDEAERAWAKADQEFRDSSHFDYSGEIEKICPSASQEVKHYIANGYSEKPEYFVEGFKQEISNTMNMIKSDNGWISCYVPT